MRHDWAPPVPRTPAERVAAYMDSPRRVCSHCGATQTLNTSYAWGRITGRQWLPLVGRCKPLQIVTL